MTSPRWLRGLAALFRTPTPRRHRHRPTLEALEDRTVPTAVALPSGAVSWWPGDGSPADLVGSNTGTLNNGATYFQGQVADGFRFDGNDYLAAPTSGLPTGKGNRTLELWVKANAFPTSGETFFAG